MLYMFTLFSVYLLHELVVDGNVGVGEVVGVDVDIWVVETVGVWVVVGACAVKI